MTSYHKTPDLLRDPIPTLLRVTSIPAITGMFFGTLYNIVDTIYAGQYSTDALAAFTMAFPIYFIFLLSTAIGFSNGLKTVIAHALGRKNDTEVGCLMMQGIPLAIICGLLINLMAYGLLDQLLEIMNNSPKASPQSFVHAKKYLSVMFLGGVCFSILYAIIAPLGAIGDTRTTRNGEVFGAIANVILNPILMFGWFGFPAMGIAGLAVATVTIWISFSLYAAWKLRQSALWTLFSLSYLKLRPDLWGKILAQSIPATINMVRIGIVFGIFAFVMNKFGTDVLAGYGVGFRIEGLIILPVIGLNFAAVAIVAQNHGAADHTRVHLLYRLTLKYGVIMMTVGGVFLYICAPILVIPFTEDIQARLYAIEYLRIDAIALPSIAIINLAGAMMQGMQRSMLSVTALIITQAVLPAIILPYIAQHYSYTAVWWAMAGILWISAFCMLTLVHTVLSRWRKHLDTSIHLRF